MAPPRQDAVPASPPLRGLPPVVDSACRILILGSFPGPRSLALRRYYGHPRNAFWRLVGECIRVPELAALDYAERLERLKAAGVGLWDVFASCRREGSADGAIRDAEVNDFRSLVRRLPCLERIAFNGGKSFSQAPWVRKQLGPMAEPLAFVRLPSSSPANQHDVTGRRQAWREAIYEFL